MIDGVARAFGGAEATAVRRRKRDFPVGGQWDKAVTGVMVSRFGPRDDGEARGWPPRPKLSTMIESTGERSFAQRESAAHLN